MIKLKELLEENGMPTITWKPLENEQIPKEATPSNSLNRTQPLFRPKLCI